MKKIFRGGRLRKGISIVASMVLFLSSIMPTVPVFGYDVNSGDVACIQDGSCYPSLQSAINAADEGDTIVMEDDYEITDTSVINMNKKITLDLNGKTISKGVDGTTYLATVPVGGDLTIIDSSEGKTGKISRSGGTTTIKVLGKLTLESGTIEGGNGCTDYAHGCNGSSIAIKIDDNETPDVYGTVDIIGGTVTSDGQAIQAWGIANINGGTINGQVNAWTYKGDSAGNITIKNGTTINGSVSAIQRYEGSDVPLLQAKVDIQGGTINGSLSAQYRKSGTPYALVTVINNEAPISSSDPRPDLRVSGGTFSEDPSEYVVEGYKAVENAEHWTVAPTYAVTVAETENGTVTANPENAAANTEVTLTVTPAEGYELDELTVMNGETPVEVTDNKFTMPAGAVTVSATFKAITYAVTVAETENGTVTANPENAAANTEVTLTVTPADGYELETLTVMNGETSVVVTDNKFTMPAGNVIVNATFIEKLVDVQAGTTATAAGVSNDISQIEVVDDENDILPGNADKVVLEQSDKATDTDEGSQAALQNKVTADLVTSTSKRANILGIVDLTFWKVLSLPNNGTKSKIMSAITFNKPINIKFKGLNKAVKIGVKHNLDLDGKYGIDLLVTQSNVDCTNIPDNVKYNGEAINPDNNGEVSIWTCGSSTFVAYEEVNNPSSGGSGGGGGGSSSYSCKNLPDNAVANNTSKPKKSTDYSYSTDADAVCTFQCKSGYAWNEKDSKCELSESATTEDNTGVDSDTADNTDTNNISDEDRAAADAQALKDGYSQEFIDAYNFARKNNITTMNTIREANMDAPLTRIAMAKMLSQYAINVLGKTPDTTKVVPTFPDVSAQLDADYNNGVTLAYQLGIMGIGIENFRPFAEVTRAEFGTALSRMLFGLADGEGAEWYKTHLDKLMNEKIITNDNPNLKELRGYVMIMLMRSAQ